MESVGITLDLLRFQLRTSKGKASAKIAATCQRNPAQTLAGPRAQFGAEVAGR